MSFLTDVALAIAGFSVIEQLTLILIIVTALYVFATFRIMRANREAVAAMQQQTEALTRPYVSIRPFVPPGSHIFYLQIENTGQTVAVGLRLQFDRSFYQLGRKDGIDLSEAYLFRETIATLPPGAVLSFILHTTPLMLKVPEDDPVTPPVFSINAKYAWTRGSADETTTIDLRMYDRGRIPDPYLEALEKIEKALQKVGRNDFGA